ncbi:MAG: hypothetical protein Tsb0020_00570 [Haliangiales bacterium]
MLEDRLTASLTLTISGTSYEIPGGQIEVVDVTLMSYGFRALVEFVLSDDQAHGGQISDELAAAFLELDLIEAKLTTSWQHLDEGSETAAEDTAITGLVEQKALTEEVYRDTSDLPVLARRYQIEFADPAQVLWRQHYPCVLYTDTSVADVLAAHKGSYIDIDCQWQDLSTAKPQFFVHLPAARERSFYDFVLWYLDAIGAVFYYDYSAAKYVVAEDKDSLGVAIKPIGDDAARVTLRVPAAPRSQPRVLNSYSEEPKTTSIEQEQAATGMYHDVLMRTPIAQDFDDRVTLETARAVLPLYELSLSLTSGPADSVVPGTLVEIDTALRWSSESAAASPTWRVIHCRLQVKASRPGPDVQSQLDARDVRGELSLTLEQKDDPRPRWPAFQCPVYPGLIEGKVVSEQGEDTDMTYQVYTDEDTSLETYQVKVPLWDDQIVSAPFQPEQGSGNVFIPAYRDARVLLEMDLEESYIRRLLDWREGAPLSMDVQGEQIYFGKNATSHTTVSHQYDSDKPVFEVARLNDKDTATIRIEEGTLTIQVKEEAE